MALRQGQREVRLEEREVREGLNHWLERRHEPFNTDKRIVGASTQVGADGANMIVFLVEIDDAS